MTESVAAVEAEGLGLGFRFGTKVALADVGLRLATGSVVGLIGRNGAGKTSLLRVLAGREPRFSGRATVFGIPVGELGWHPGMVHLGGVSWTLAADLRLVDLARHLSRFHPDFDMERLRELFAWFEIPGTSHLWQLSAGRRTAANMCLALATRARLTLLDEPHLALDAPTRELMTRLLAEELATGERTWVVSTHMVNETAGLFGDVVLLDKGRLVAHDDAEQLTRAHVRVLGAPDVVGALPRLGGLSRLGARASAVVRREHADGLPTQAVTLQELAAVLGREENGEAA
ncbi:ABC transporter ATP-binding protein [Tessaracoccus terricola]